MVNQNASKGVGDGTVVELKNYRHLGAEWGIYGAATSTQPTAVADASGGGTVDAEARTALNDLLARLRTLGVIAT